jgi:hypothetical protein
MTSEPEKKPAEPSGKMPEWQSSLPFPRRWLVYIAIKLAILLAAVLITLRIYGLV